MKKWISLITAIACALSSSIYADEALVETLEQEQQIDIAADADEAEAPKQVGKVSADAANAARTSKAGKYLLAAGAVALGVTAIILVSRHHGHH